MVLSCRYPGLKKHPSHARAKQYFRPHMYGPVLSFRVRGGREAGQYKPCLLLIPSLRPLPDPKLRHEAAGDSTCIHIHTVTHIHMHIYYLYIYYIYIYVLYIYIYVHTHMYRYPFTDDKCGGLGCGGAYGVDWDMVWCA
jgi:hypothetical protein